MPVSLIRKVDREECPHVSRCQEKRTKTENYPLIRQLSRLVAPNLGICVAMQKQVFNQNCKRIMQYTRMFSTRSFL